MTRNELVEYAKKVVAAGSCCPELKEIGTKWIADPEDATLTKQFIEELREDVTSIDGLISFTASDAGKQVFGAEAAQKMHAAAEDAKKKGVKYCICDACTNGGVILDHAAELLV